MNHRRAQLLAPYAPERERSMEAKAAKGLEPASLGAQVRWFRELLNDEIPVDIHDHAIWRDYGRAAEGGSTLGSPRWSDPFRRFLENSPHEADEDGFYTRPLRAAITRFSDRWPVTARHLYQLALVDGDWHRHAEWRSWEYEEMELYIGEALRRLWREFADRTLRLP